MNNTNTIEAEPTAEQIEQTRSAKCFTRCEDDFTKTEADIAFMRRWIEGHKDALAPFDWHVSKRSINFCSWPEVNANKKAIARAFGKEGWKREKDSYTCGAIHWVKADVDGVELKIHEAEKVELKPIEAVKL